VIDTASKEVAKKHFNEDAISIISPFVLPMPYPTSSYAPQGPGRHVSYILDTLPTSGKAYITIKATKDMTTQAVMSQINEEIDDFDVIIPIIGDSAAFKRAKPLSPSVAPRKNKIVMDIFPNPFNTSATVKLQAIKDASLSVVIYDVLGKEVMTMYNSIADKEQFEFRISSSQLTSASYFIRVANGSEILTKKLEILR